MKYGAEDLWASIVGYVATIQHEALIQGLTVSFINYDEHADIEKLPQENLVGPAEFSFDNMGQGTFHVSAAIGFSMWNDDEQFNHRKMMDIVAKHLEPEMSIPILKATTGLKIGSLTLEAPTSLLPMSNSDVRALQFYVFSGTAHVGP